MNDQKWLCNMEKRIKIRCENIFTFRRRAEEKSNNNNDDDDHESRKTNINMMLHKSQRKQVSEMNLAVETYLMQIVEDIDCKKLTGFIYITVISYHLPLKSIFSEVIREIVKFQDVQKCLITGQDVETNILTHFKILLTREWCKGRSRM